MLTHIHLGREPSEEVMSKAMVVDRFAKYQAVGADVGGLGDVTTPVETWVQPFAWGVESYQIGARRPCTGSSLETALPTFEGRYGL